MPKIGGLEHETQLRRMIAFMKKNGFEVVYLQGFSPDAIAVRAGRVFALDVITYSKRGNDLEIRANAKIDSYSAIGFHNVLAMTFNEDGWFHSIYSRGDVDSEKPLIRKIAQTASSVDWYDLS